ncbi:MAG: right-handed parallel beta-helix repeat-containing protein, partial [archaeon]
MKRGIKHKSLFAILTLSFLFFLVSLSNVNAVDIDDCATLSTPNEIYTLNQSVSSSVTCFTIDANNITLDCDGFNITGASYNNYGVYFNGRTDTKVRNCVISSFFFGIYGFSSSNNGIYTNNTMNDNDNGFYIGGSDNNTFVNNTVSNNRARGFYISNSDNNRFTNNTGNSNGLGTFYLVNAQNNTFINNTITGGGFHIQTIYSDYSYYRHDIDSTNTVNGKPARYYDDINLACPNDTVLDLESNYSFIGFLGCNNVTLE